VALRLGVALGGTPFGVPIVGLVAEHLARAGHSASVRPPALRPQSSRSACFVDQAAKPNMPS
jgi:hypothetical protein